jgi:hypothetical protein
VNDTSFAAQAVARGPHTVAPPSFDGHGWLVVINLVVMTGAMVMATTTVAGLIGDAWRTRSRDRHNDPIAVWRIPLICFATAMALRTGVEALILWGWNPLDPVGTGWLQTFKRFVDPFSVAFGLVGLAVVELSKRGMGAQLLKRPFPINMWASLPMLKRPAMVCLLALIAAIGVVSTR